MVNEIQFGGGSSILIDSGTDTSGGGDIYELPQNADALDVEELLNVVKLLLADSATAPSADGEMRLNNGDVEIHSGGSVRNVSNIGSGSGLTSVATGTVTATGGAGVPGPAVDTVLAGVSGTQTQQWLLTVYVSSDPTFNADYAFDVSATHQWHDSDGQLDIPLTVDWQIDPGAGNDLTLAWEVLAP